MTDIQEIQEINIQLPQGVPPLSTFYLYVAGSCNLACRHCWIVPKFQPDGVGGPYIKLEHVEKAIREGKPLGLRSIKLTGGEPMLHPQFRQLVTMIDDAGIDMIMETNGTLIDPEMAAFLRSKSHMWFISVSLDGAATETHEALRIVKGSYDWAVSGIKNLVEVGFRPQVICTLHRGNVSELADVVKLAEQLGCGSVKFNHVQRSGRGEIFPDEQVLTIPEIIQLFGYLESEIVPTVQFPIYFDIPVAFYPIRKLLQVSMVRCRLHNILGILANGELALCGIGTTIPDLIYGNIEKDELRRVWCNAPGLARLREQIPAQLEGICGQCLHQNTCQGECIANNYQAAGRLNAPYNFCDLADAMGLFPESRKKGKDALID